MGLRFATRSSGLPCFLGSGLCHLCLWGTSAWAIVPYALYARIYASSSDSRWHESGHGTAFKTDWMNNALYEIASFMIMREATVWRWSHNRHHSDTIIVGRDREIAVPVPPTRLTDRADFFNLRYLRRISSRSCCTPGPYVRR